MATRSAAAVGIARPRAARTESRAAVSSDPAVLLTVTTATLVLLGLVMILSASSVSSFATYGSSFMFFKKQVLWASIGVVGFIACARMDYRRLRGIGYGLIVVVAALLVLVLVPSAGIVAGGSARWLDLGPFSFQPSELAKLALVLFAADVLSRKRESSLARLSHTFVPVVPLVGLLAILVMMQPDLGTTLLLTGIGFGVLFVAGAPMRFLVPMGLVGAVLGLAAAFGEGYRRARILSFLDPWADPLNTGYQVIQSLLALGSGGWFGVGLGASRQKWSYIPNAHTDFIYAILGEETGLAGTLIVLGMFAFLAYLGIRTARSAPDRFGMLVASGITLWISIQALVNMGAVTAALPVTGVPLPLVSFGGSSLVVCLVAMGILTSISRAGSATRARKRSR